MATTTYQSFKNVMPLNDNNQRSNPINSFLRWMRGRKTHNVLSKFSDRQLHDIGLIRGDIDRMSFEDNLKQ